MTKLPYTVVLHESSLMVFIPKGDDTFASASHDPVLIVSTPQGDYLFERPAAIPDGNHFRNEFLALINDDRTTVIETRAGFEECSDYVS